MINTVNKLIEKAKLICFLISFLFPCSISLAQVTIGNREEPLEGALLQLKEDENSGVNSTKGLVLPRLQITRHTDVGFTFGTPWYSVTETQKNQHIGLTVYNLYKCMFRGYGEGIYTWDGAEWQYVGNRKDESVAYVYSDQEGNTFNAASFGDAGIWMTDNLRATTYAPGALGPAIIDENENPVFNELPMVSPDIVIDPDNQVDPADLKGYWLYPYRSVTVGGVKGSDGTNPEDFNWDPAMGLLYSWVAATKGMNIPADHWYSNFAEGNMRDQAQRNQVTAHQAEVESVYGHVQGICPDGWHLPSDREWNELEKEIYDNPHKYTDFTNTEIAGFSPQSWNPDWEWGRNDSGLQTPHQAELLNTFSSGWRGSDVDGKYGHGAAMKKVCNLFYRAGAYVNPSSALTYGRSNRNTFGGFDLVLAGWGAKQYNGVFNYAGHGYFWTSSANMYGLSKNAYARYFDGENASVSRLNNDWNHFFSVRCKKNTNTP